MQARKPPRRPGRQKGEQPMEEIILLLQQIKEQLEVRNKLTLSVDEAAQMLGLSRPRVMELAHSDGFPAFTVGKRILINAKGLAEWVDKKAGLAS